MAQTSYQGQIPGTGNLVITSNIRPGFKRSSASGNGTRRPVPVNHVPCETSKQDTTNFQPKDIEQLCSHGEVQTRKFGPSEVNAQDQRLSHEAGSDGCILFGADSGRSQEIPEIPISGCDIRIPGFTIRYILRTSSIHQVTETSGCHSQIGRHSISDLSGRSSTTSPQCGRTTKSFQTCDNPSCGLGAHYQTREMLTSANTSHYLSGGTAKFNQSDYCSPTRETVPLTAGVQCNPVTEMLLHAVTLISVGSNESHCPDWDLGGTITLSGPSTTVHCLSAQERPVHEIQEIPDLSVEGSIVRTPMVDFRSADSCQRDSVNPTSNRHDSIDRCVKERLGSLFSSSEDRWSVAERGSQSTHQCAGTEGSLSGSSSVCEKATTSNPHSAATGQLDCSVVHKQARGDTLTLSGVHSPRDMGLLHLTQDLANSKPRSWCDEHRCRFCLEKFQQPYRMDSGQDGLSENNEPILHPRGRPICFSHQQSLTTLRSEIPRPRFNSNRCLSPALGAVDSIHTCPNSSTSTHSPEDTARSSNRIGDRSNLGGITLISHPTGVTGGLSSSVANNGRKNLPALRSASNTPDVANSPTSCMASVRSRLQTAGF